MAYEFSVAVRKTLDTVVDSLRSPTANLEPPSQGDRDIRWAESAAMSFYRGADGADGIWGTTYGNMMSGTKDDGNPFYNPDIKEAQPRVQTSDSSGTPFRLGVGFLSHRRQSESRYFFREDRY
jgi:hypothetical protein